MKRLFLIVFFTITLSLQKAEAQLAPVGTKWTYLDKTYDPNQSPIYYIDQYFASDTLINGTIFSHISSGKWGKLNGIYLTSENGRVFYYLQSKKNLLFDFNAKQNDTVYVDLCIRSQYSQSDSLIPNYPIKIEKIYYYHISTNDSIVRFNYSGLKYIDSSGDIFNAPNYGSINSKIIIFGHFANLTVGLLPYLFQKGIWEHEITFRCYEEPNGYLIKTASNVNCGHLGIGEINNFEKSISIFPNPSSGEFTLEVNGNLKPKKITVYNILGDLVKTENTSDGKNFKVSLKENASGNYFVVVELEPARTERGGNEVRVVKKVILEK